VLLALAGPAPAHWDRTALIVNVPTADVLPTGSLAFSVNGSVRNWFSGGPHQWSDPELGAAVRFAPIDRLELALTAYTLQDYVLGVSYRLLGSPGGAGLAVGVHDIGWNNYVSPIGHGRDGAWGDWRYDLYSPPYDRPTENFSAFAVGSIPLSDFANVHLGFGRGRYVGYSRGLNINTDAFFDQTHWWAVGLFGGLEVNFGKHVSLGAELDGRDVNAGLKLNFGPVSAALAATKLEGYTAKPAENRFGRFDAMVSYQLDNLYRRNVRPKAPDACATPPEPAAQLRPIVAEVKDELMPIYFDLDKSDIRPADAEILKRNAAAILARVKAGKKGDVVISGHCCPYASDEYNVALGMRRAESARAYLIGLGVDGALLTTVTYGEAQPPYLNEIEYYLDRRCEFEFKWKE